ncbi:MAG: 4-hydroxythreonine-4-phosphate dehydrogenase PdxA [Balneolaceae bacterium]
MSAKPIIAISMGDYNGIGPEVILKALKRIDRSRSRPILIGFQELFQFYQSKWKDPFQLLKIQQGDEIPSLVNRPDTSLPVLEIKHSEGLQIEPGIPTAHTGTCSMEAVSTGVDLCLQHQADALVTAPISKEAISMAGFRHPGHTEFLAERTGTDHVQMILTSDTLRVALATVHVPLSKVPKLINRQRIRTELAELHLSMQRDFGIPEPRLALLGLNPHAGDGGVIGREEIEILRPELDSANKRGIQADGPFAADGFFGSGQWRSYDAILAMYHDQGLIPFKTLSFGRGVNFTAGLPIIRTSPDHGTGFDIAGQGQAESTSFEAAYNLAVSMATRQHHEA